MHETYTILKIVVKRNSDKTSIDKIIIEYLEYCHLEYKRYNNSNNKETIFVIKINWRDYYLRDCLMPYEVCYKMCKSIKNFNEFQEQISITFTFNSKDEDDYNSNNFIGDFDSNNFTEDSDEFNKLHLISFPPFNDNKVVKNVINGFKKYLILESATAVIVTDNYILKTNLDTIKELFSKLKQEVTRNLKKVIFIISGKLGNIYPIKEKGNNESDEEFKLRINEIFEQTFSNIGLELKIVEAEAQKAFHDRFWLFCDNNGSKDGLIIGTSLNGLKSSYTIIARMEKEDVLTLFNILDKEIKELNEI